MDKSKEELILEDYRTSLSLICHEDKRKADLFKIFTFAQGVFFTFYNLNYNKHNMLVSAICILAILFSLYWCFVMEKMRAVISAKYLYIQHLEKQLEHISNITIEMNLKKSGYQEIGEYKFNMFQKISVSKTESLLPIFVAIVWVVLYLMR